jgi:hypothetical protein
MNSGTCWGKNTIGPRGLSVEKPREATLTFNLFININIEFTLSCFILLYLASARQNIWNILCQNMDYAVSVRDNTEFPYLRIICSL